MKYLPVLFLFILTTLFIIHSSNVFAANFTSAYQRLDRMQSNSPLSGLVCATPSALGAGTEAKISITYPSDFTISGSTANWTSTTSNIPTGALSWPSIGATAESVSGKTVTFSGGDLTSNTDLYCFNFTGASSTTGATGAKTGFIESKNSSNIVIDSTEYGLTIVGSDQVTVSATIAADPLDFDNELSILTSGTTFPQDTELKYQTTYGSNLPNPVDLDVVAEWSLGTLSGDPTPTIDILDYVISSATNAYGGAPPVIDTVNRTITWSISSFPANTTGETVSFTLITNDSYTGSKAVEFSVSSHLEPPATSTSDSTITRDYLFDTSLVPTPTPGPTATPGPTTSTPTPSPTPSPNTIASIQVRTVDSGSATIFAQVTNDSTLSLSYGISINNLDETITLPRLRKTGLFTLRGLDDNTKYFYRISATEVNKKVINSDFYTFTTAKISVKPLIDVSSLVAISEDAILSFINSLGIKKDEELIKKIVIPVDTFFKIKFSLLEETNIVSATAIVRNKSTLGATSSTEADINKIELIEIEPGVFSGSINSGSLTGKYEVFISLRDINGNITEEKLSDLRTVNKFRVLSKNNDQPVEGARVFFSIYNPASKLWVQIPSKSISKGNPVFTNRDGELDLVLPQGKYKAEISSLKYEKQTIEFVLGYDSGEGYPTVLLEDGSPGILGYFNYYLTIINDVFFGSTRAYFQNLTGSLRFFDLMAFITLGSLIFITFLAFSRRHHIPLSSMHTYFYYLFDSKSRHENYVTGVVFDEDDKPISSANIYIQDSDDEKIVGNVETNKKGEFFWKKKSDKEYLVMVTAKEFKSTEFLQFSEKEHLKFRVTLEKSNEGLNIIENSGIIISHGIGMVFEVLLVLTLLFQILFIAEFGLLKTLPFLIVSILNLLLWILVIHHHRTNVR